MKELNISCQVAIKDDLGFQKDSLINFRIGHIRQAIKRFTIFAVCITIAVNVLAYAVLSFWSPVTIPLSPFVLMIAGMLLLLFLLVFFNRILLVYWGESINSLCSQLKRTQKSYLFSNKGILQNIRLIDEYILNQNDDNSFLCRWLDINLIDYLESMVCIYTTQKHVFLIPFHQLTKDEYQQLLVVLKVQAQK